MGKKLDLTGMKFGKLTAVREVGKNNKGSFLWLWDCDCGGTLVSIGAVVKNGNTSSCGCAKREATVRRNTTHGMSKNSAYSNWKDMFKRCYNPNNKRYKDYHERGIGVDEHFRHFPNFLEEIGEKPNDGQVWTVGRIDNNIGYVPGNIRWETLAEQARNHTMQSNNTSGIVGVKLQTKVINGTEYESWVATWSDGLGSNKTKNFSTNKYGFEGAKQLAIAAREEGLRKLKEQGIEYADSHDSGK